jgi:hypothetical protein
MDGDRHSAGQESVESFHVMDNSKKASEMIIESCLDENEVNKLGQVLPAFSAGSENESDNVQVDFIVEYQNRNYCNAIMLFNNVFIFRMMIRIMHLNILKLASGKKLSLLKRN